MEYNEVYSKVMQELVRAGSSETVSDLGAHRMNIDKLIKPYEALNPEDSRATDLKNLAESSLLE